MNQAKTPTFLFQWSDFFFNQIHSIGCSFKFIFNAGIEDKFKSTPDIIQVIILNTKIFQGVLLILRINDN
jgi:hypothetical protein